MSTPVRPFVVPSEYLPLYAYLDGRYADALVLTFADIEALVGFALPAAARLLPGWWSNEDQDDAPLHAAAWILAGRTARPKLAAAIVTFERVSA